MFNNLTQPSKLTKLDGDFRWTFDPTNSPMFRRFESGYYIFLVLSIPNMLAKLTEVQKGEVTGIRYQSLYGDLISSYVRTLEREFKQLSGLENISSEGIEFSGLNEVSVNSLNKTEEVHNPTISLTYTEPFGAVLSRTHELFLKGIDDPIIGHRKHYNGLIDDGILAPSFKNEVFSFLYIVTDNTGLQLERAFYLFNAQPTTSHTGDLYTGTRGEYEFKELSIEFKCNMLSNQVVFNKAKTILEAITGYHHNEETGKLERIASPLFSRDSTNFNYRALTDPNPDIGTLNFPKGKSKGIEYIQAHLRQLGEKDEVPPSNSSENINTIIADNAKTYTPEDGDTKQSESLKEIDIDSPVANIGDRIYIKTNATLATCVGHKSTPSTSKFKSSSANHVYEIVDIFSRTAAKSWAQRSNNGKVYHSDSILFAYVVKIDGKKKSYLNARDFYIQDGKNWADPETGLKISVKDGSILAEDPLYKALDVIKLKSGTAVYYSYVRNIIIGIPVDDDKEYTILEVANKEKATAYAQAHKTNNPYSGTNCLHAYKIDVQIGNKTMNGFINERDIILLGSAKY